MLFSTIPTCYFCTFFLLQVPLISCMIATRNEEVQSSAHPNSSSDETLKSSFGSSDTHRFVPLTGYARAAVMMLMYVRQSGKVTAPHVILMKERSKDVRYEKFREVSPDCVERFMLQSGLTSLYLHYTFFVRRQAVFLFYRNSLCQRLSFRRFLT